MRKTISTQTTRTIHVCDLCQKQIDSPDNCWLCRREVCYQCRKLMFCGKSEDWVELPMVVCRVCQEHKADLDLIADILGQANGRLREVVETLKRKTIAPKRRHDDDSKPAS